MFDVLPYLAAGFVLGVVTSGIVCRAIHRGRHHGGGSGRGWPS